MRRGFIRTNPFFFFRFFSSTQLVDILVKAGADYGDKVTKEDEEEKYTSVWELCGVKREHVAMLGGSWTPGNHRRHPKRLREAIVWYVLIIYNIIIFIILF